MDDDHSNESSDIEDYSTDNQDPIRSIDDILDLEIKKMLQEGYEISDVPDMISEVMISSGECPSFDFIYSIYQRVYPDYSEKKLEEITGSFLYTTIGSNEYKRNKRTNLISRFEQKYQ